jgi:FMN phosphatase YigB (HAD superfamily)
MPERVLIVTDIDNTIYDWVGVWAAAIRALLQTLADLSDRPIEYWVKAARPVHARRGATECPSLLSDMAASATWPPSLDASRILPRAAAVYRDHWDRALTPYPGVRDALTELAARGHSIVGYTESDVSIASCRLARLGLSGVIRRVFGRPALPHATIEGTSLVDVSPGCSIATDFIPREDIKPNPAGLHTILSHCGKSARDALYVGDNLCKDVAMANRLGVASCWARYGTARAP